MIIQALTALTIGAAGLCGSGETAWGIAGGVICLDDRYVRFIAKVAPCESPEAWYEERTLTWHIYSNPEAVGDHGQSRGTMQIHGPTWIWKMAEMGLGFEKERDRLRMGEWIFLNIGPGQWSCWKEE